MKIIYHVYARIQRYSPIVIALNFYFSSSKNDEIKHFLENFRLSGGQPFSKIRLPPPNLTRDGQMGNCLFLTLPVLLYKSGVQGGIHYTDMFS